MAELYKGKIPVVRRDLNEGFLRGAPGPVAFGCVPRDFTVDPVRVGDSPAGIKTYSDAELQAEYDAAAFAAPRAAGYRTQGVAGS